MSNVHDLLKAIRLNPLEDTPRLLLADCIQEEQGNEDACGYIKESIDFFRRGTSRRRFRSKLTRGYMAWLGSVLGCKLRPELDSWNGFTYVNTSPLTDCIIANTNDSFDWLVGDRRRATFVIARGLPVTVSPTCPLLMEQPEKLFQFPVNRCLVSDRRPNRDNFFGQTEWYWEGCWYPQKFNTWEEVSFHIPLVLHNMFPTTYRNTRGHYRTKADAVLSLNAVALEWGEAAIRKDEKVA